MFLINNLSQNKESSDIITECLYSVVCNPLPLGVGRAWVEDANKKEWQWKYTGNLTYIQCVNKTYPENKDEKFGQKIDTLTSLWITSIVCVLIQTLLEARKLSYMKKT